MLLIPVMAGAETTATNTLLPADTSSNPLEGLLLGDGQWKPLERTTARGGGLPATRSTIPPTFLTYAARLLIRYDAGVAVWWASIDRRYSLMADDQRAIQRNLAFGSLACSIERALDPFLQQQQPTPPTPTSVQVAYTALWDLFVERYGREFDAKRQISLLFCLLPDADQPLSRLQKLKTGTVATKDLLSTSSAGDDADGTTTTSEQPTSDMTDLLPANYQCVAVRGTAGYSVYPGINLFEIGVDEEFGQTAVATAFGPLSETPLTRELPNYSLQTYGLFAVSGAAGCALTHSVVIPLDVVKTRAQTDPDEYQNLLQGAVQIVQKEGLQGLLLGAQATLAGYTWYGMSVYPSYTFFKRFLAHSVLSPAVATVHANDVALLAGAMASVIASLGLTPMEAARIRVVAEPETYKPLGLLGTLSVIANEDSEKGWKGLYAGLPSLLTRQVIFGSVKFLAFERASAFIFCTWPVLRDETWTSLAVSLVAGGLSGVLSSVVSQPADSVLTYVSQTTTDQRSSGLGVVEGCRTMVETEGVGALFRGLGSRCVWAGSIIAGQFLLYDVFRTYFGVSADDLSQVYQVILPAN
jgi:solute carrier family 25 phosphate transporter 3